MPKVLCVLGVFIALLPGVATAQMVSPTDQAKTYRVAVSTQLPVGLAQQQQSPLAINVDATPCGFVPFAELGVLCRVTPEGDHAYEFWSTKQPFEKITGVKVPPIVRRVDVVLAPDLDGYRADVRVTLNVNLLSGRRSTQIPLF